MSWKSFYVWSDFIYEWSWYKHNSSQLEENILIVINEIMLQNLISAHLIPIRET